jgi:glucosylceramidase
MVFDHNWSHPEYPATILGDPAAARFAAGTAYHCYEGKVEAQSETHKQFPDKDIWETECSGGTWQKDAFQQTAKLIIGTTRNWSKSVVLWGLALDPDGNPHAGGCGTCRGVITVDKGKFAPTLDFYALGQVSKFVVPGAHRIGSSDLEAKGLPNVAFQNPDGSVALVVLNDSAAAVSFDISSEGKIASYTLASNTMATLQWIISKPVQ